MRCQGCNKNLSDKESVRKDRQTGTYLDLCSKCYKDTKEDLAELLPADEGEDEYD